MGFKANPAGIRALESTEAMGRAMLHHAERVADRAREIAPVDTGAYKASIKAEVVDRDGKKVGRVSADPVSPDGEHYASYIEFGTSKMDAQRVLGRSLDVLRGT